MKRIAAGLLLLMVMPAAAQDFDPTTLDLPALVECRSTIPEYNNFGFWLSTEPDAAARLGWTEVATDNLFLREFALPKPVRAFERSSSMVVFTASGPMLVIEGTDAAALATGLGLSVFHASGDKFLAEKVVSEFSEKEGGLTARGRIAINVSTVDTHPGKVLAGCSYTFEIG